MRNHLLFPVTLPEIVCASSRADECDAVPPVAPKWCCNAEDECCTGKACTTPRGTITFSRLVHDRLLHYARMNICKGYTTQNSNEHRQTPLRANMQLKGGHSRHTEHIATLGASNTTGVNEVKL